MHQQNELQCTLTLGAMAKLQLLKKPTYIKGQLAPYKYHHVKLMLMKNSNGCCAFNSLHTINI